MLGYKLQCKQLQLYFSKEKTSFCKTGDSFIDCKIKKAQKTLSGKSPSQTWL